MADRFTFERLWGAELLDGGRAKFRLWAPGQQDVWLVGEAAGTRQQMSRLPDGWFELITDAVPPGTGYAFELANGLRVPDPAARAQMGDVHGPSRLLDPDNYRWRNETWRGRPWNEAVIYEIHTGTFCPEGTFAGIETRLDHLADIGITAIELMPVAQFSGSRGWGYDGVLLYAPHSAYGDPDDLKRLVDAAHDRGLMVLLDVVYNHFGPDGNYLSVYAPAFFDAGRPTPWGAAIDYTQAPVRRFVIENALHWLTEYRLDGLRLDAIDYIEDPSSPSILEELAGTVRSLIPDRHIHLTTEDSRNINSLHQRDAEGRPTLYTAEWNDDVHHAAHVLATGEADGYYIDYQAQPAAMLARALATGYIYQGERSVFRDGPRGEPSASLPPLAFIDFLQNHDQIGNRGCGERLSMLASAEAIEVLTAILLLSPHVPLLFMGEEWGETRPFLFFTDFHGELGDAVREGRRNEFKCWRCFHDPEERAKIPDPNAMGTFLASKLDWEARSGSGSARADLVRRLLALRQAEIAPRLEGLGGNCAIRNIADGSGVHVAWQLGDGSEYGLTANLANAIWQVPPPVRQTFRDAERLVFDFPAGSADALGTGLLSGWSTVFTISGPEDE
jgi:maltooligosyltrehalose trehalohydrolase